MRQKIENIVFGSTDNIIVMLFSIKNYHKVKENRI